MEFLFNYIFFSATSIFLFFDKMFGRPDYYVKINNEWFHITKVGPQRRKLIQARRYKYYF